MLKLLRFTLMTVCVVLLSACSTTRTPVSYEWNTSSDPLEPVNRSIYKFNTTADKYVLRPVAKGYDAAVPDPAKRGVSNFFANLGEPLNAINNLLQGKFDQALGSTYRFTVNSTIGLLGLFDVAAKQGVAEAPEDLGQTLAVWGVKPGPYLVVPFLGPTNLRDGLGRAAASSVYFPINEITESAGSRAGLNALRIIETRARFLGVDGTLEKQLDPYLFVKTTLDNARTDAINDGEVVEVELEYDF